MKNMFRWQCHSLCSCSCVFVLVALTFVTFAACPPAQATKVVRAGKTTTKGPPVWEKPKPGHHVDGAGQLVLSGTNVTFYLTAGSAQLDLHDGEGRVFLPAGARYKERRNNRFYETKQVPDEGDGQWFDRDVRRLIFLAGRSVGTEEAPIRVEGDSWMIIRGYNAAVQFRIDEVGEEFAQHRFPLRDPVKEARDERRRRERLARLNSKDPYVREAARYRERGGLYKVSSQRDSRGVFRGY